MLRATLVLLLGLLLSACGGGGGDSSTSSGGGGPTTPAPSALSYSSPTTTTQGVAMTALSPTVTGTVTSYSVSPALPAGITLNTTTGQISGTPSAAAAQATYTVTASNATAGTTFGLVLTVRSGNAVSGTAASGTAIGNGVVTLKDSSSPAKTVTTTTDANGNYVFTAAQIQTFTAPFMLEIVYQVGGVNYSLHSAVTREDVTGGNATINITPLTDLVIANVANDIAANVFAKSSYSSLLTKTALDSGVQALNTLLQPVLAQMGVSASVDLLRQSFTANGTGVDAVLDALKVTIDPSVKAETITNRLNNTSITGTLSVPPTTPLTTTTANNITDLQAITTTFANFSAEMAKAPAATDPALLAFFDQTNFQHDGQNLATFLQQITTNPVIAGGALTFSDIVLSSVPSWLTLPTGTTGYQVTFTVLKNQALNGRVNMILYNGNGTWRNIGNKLRAKVQTAAFEGNNNGALCSGMQFNIADKGAIGVSYAVVTGPGVPAAGVLLFNTGSNQSLTLAAVAPAQYAGTNTSRASISCSYNNVYAMSDAQIQLVTVPAVYTVKLYNDSGTPTNLADDILLATYTQPIFSAPLLSAAVTTSLFPSGISASPTVVSAAPTGGSVKLSWSAPTAPGEYASSVDVYVCGASGCQDTGGDLAGTATSVNLAVPMTSSPTTASATVEYIDSGFREIWASPLGGSNF